MTPSTIDELIMEKKRTRAEAKFNGDGVKNHPRARVPAAVRQKFGASVGDLLIFDEGCMQSVERAALEGLYFVVRLKRAEPQPAPEQIEENTMAAPVESLAETVARKQREAQAPMKGLTT